MTHAQEIEKVRRQIFAIEAAQQLRDIERPLELHRAEQKRRADAATDRRIYDKIIADQRKMKLPDDDTQLADDDDRLADAIFAASGGTGADTSGQEVGGTDAALAESLFIASGGRA